MLCLPAPTPSTYCIMINIMIILISIYLYLAYVVTKTDEKSMAENCSYLPRNRKYSNEIAISALTSN